MLEFRTLGTLELQTSAGREVSALLSQPKRLALLVYLVLSRPRRLHRRDTLLALFWPELDQARARHALNQALHFLRARLGSEVVVARGAEEIGIDPEHVRCDALQFEQELEQGDPAAALALYNGDLLDGFFVSEAPEFERWLEEERVHLRKRAAEAASALADRSAAAGEPMEVARWARRAASLEPFNEKAQRRLMRALDAIGDRAGALQAVQEFSRRMSDELGVAPSPETRALEATIRARETPSAKSTVDTPALPRPAATSPRAERPVHQRHALAGLLATLGAVTIVGAIVGLLAIRRLGSDGRLHATEQRSIGRAPSAEPGLTKDEEANELYLRGMYLLRDRTEPRTRSAIELFERAIARDSTFARAHAGLADAYIDLAEFAHPASILPKAKIAAATALRLNPSLVETHLVLGDLLLISDHDWRAAEEEYRRAITLDERSAAAHERYARFLAATRRFDEHLRETRAALEIERAAASDPVAFAVREHVTLAGAYFAARQFDTALEHGRKAVELDPSSWTARAVLGRTYVELSRYAEAIGELERAWQMSQRTPALARLGYAYARSGRTARARRILADFQARAETTYVPSDQIALLQLGLGDREAALASLERAYDEHHWWLPWINQSPPFDTLRSDPRFLRLLEKLGIH